MLEVQIDSLGPQQIWQAWDRVRRLEAMLALDPRNAVVLVKLGHIFLTELEQPRKAEMFFRQALTIDPSDENVRVNLLAAIRERSLIYQTLTLPKTVTYWVMDLTNNTAIHLFVMGWATWLGIYFLPAAWLYERMVLADYLPVRWRVLAPLTRILRWPSWVRLLFSVTLISGLFFLAIWKIGGLAPWRSAGIIAKVFGFHFALVAGKVGWRRLRVWFGRRKAVSVVRAAADGSESGN